MFDFSDASEIPERRLPRGSQRVERQGHVDRHASAGCQQQDDPALLIYVHRAG